MFLSFTIVSQLLDDGFMLGFFLVFWLLFFSWPCLWHEEGSRPGELNRNCPLEKKEKVNIVLSMAFFQDHRQTMTFKMLLKY